MKIIQAFENSDILLKGISKAIKSDIKKTTWKWFRYNFRYFRCIFIRKFIKWKEIIQSRRRIIQINVRGRAGRGDNKCDCKKK